MLRRALIVILLAALALPTLAVAAPLTFDSSGPWPVLTTTKALPATAYAATCDYTGEIVGTNAVTSSPRGHVSVQTLLTPPPGPFTCWLRTDPDDANAPAAPARNGRLLLVRGVIPG